VNVADLRLALASRCDSTVTHYGKWAGQGNVLVREPLPTDPLPERFGVYPVAPGDDRTRIGVLDFDNHGDPPLDWAAICVVAAPVIAHLAALGHHPMPFRSTGGAGIHVWLVWDDLQSAAAVRALLVEAAESCGLELGEAGVADGQVEIFPKQNDVPDDGVGSCVDPPLAGKSVALDPDTLTPTDAAPMTVSSRPLADVERPPEDGRKQPKWDSDLIRSALATTPADDYGTWIDVLRSLKGGAIKAKVDDDEARAIALEWSVASEKHSDREFDYKWSRAFRKEMAGRGRSLGTLFWIAQQNGWERPTPPCPIAAVRVVESEPRTYLVTLSGYEDKGEIAIRVDDVLTKQRWQKVIMERIDQIVNLPKPQDLNRLLREAERISAGEDGTLVGWFKVRLVQFLEEHHHRDLAEVRAGRSWYDEVSGRSWFRWQDLWDWLRRRRHYDVDQPAALYFLRQLGGDIDELDLGGDYGTTEAWWVPIDPRATTPEPQPVLIPTDEKEPF